MKKLKYIFTLAIVLIFGCSCAQKFDIKELSKSGKIAIISNSTYYIFYAPSPFTNKEKEHEDIEEIEAFLEGFPLAKILRQKLYNALINYDSSLDLLPDSTIENMEDTYLPSFLAWAKKNHVNAIIHLESMLEISHAYRPDSFSLKNYPKIWTKIRIIRVGDSEVLWTKRIWTHVFDGTASGLKSYSAYDTVLHKKYLEPLINRKINYIVQSLLNSFKKS